VFRFHDSLVLACAGMGSFRVFEQIKEPVLRHADPPWRS